ncbi:DUF995 domain-containing protein [Epibacterium sp. Ofav1-8]|jgi:hypothetical protein|uniref:DUF995 domain-containing protein n=1 Tax=Epibacterium sp. Ofav1-8 TaxID=2917735 RepID=UPI001EF41168|nr:DUF995 domain-containing protein [Epibacterium sp. Ofav1-8]MCG7624655.1 DUF995 domain-containing protein [Epibacterium sp. Ofav1-8]
MVPLVKTLLSLSLVASLPAAAFADPKPRNARPAPVDKVIGAYAGKTDLWEQDCGGGIYFSPNNQVRAWCAENSENMAAGTWTVSADGTLCQNLTWYYPQGNAAGSSAAEPLCIQHVVNGWGVMYRSWPGSTEWWPVTSATSTLKRGYVFQSDVDTAKNKLGL